MKDLLIFPFGGNARETVAVVEAINRDNKQWNILGFIDDNPLTWNQEFAGYKVLGGREILENYNQTNVIAVPGSSTNYFNRDKVISSLGISENLLVTLIHPSAQIGPGYKIGLNTLIMAGVVITANVSIGNHCVILPNSVISHDSVIEDYCMLGSNVSISGSVTVKRQSYIGTGSKLIQEITIEEKTLVGLGAIVIRSTEVADVIAGNPAKVLRKQEL